MNSFDHLAEWRVKIFAVATYFFQAMKEIRILFVADKTTIGRDMKSKHMFYLYLKESLKIHF